MAPKTVILVVEDEAIIRMGAVQMLEDAGFTVVEAGNAHDAVSILEDRNDVRAIFTDINMPGTMDGIEVGPNGKRPLAANSPDCHVRTCLSRRR